MGDVFSAGYDIGNLSPEHLAEEAAELLTHPFEAALAALDAVPSRSWRDSAGTLRRRAGTRPGLRFARLLDARPARDAARAPRRRLLAHRAAALRRRDRRRAHARAVPHRAADGRNPRAVLGPRQRGRRRRPARAVALAAQIATLSPLSCGATSASYSPDPATRPGLSELTRCATRPSAPRTSPRASAPSPRNAHRAGKPEPSGRGPYRPPRAHSTPGPERPKDRGCWISRTAWTS